MEYWEVINIIYTAKETEILLHNLNRSKPRVMRYTESELEILIHNLKARNKDLVYLHTTYTKDKQIRFVFRDKYYNNYEIDARNKIVSIDPSLR